MLEILRHTQEDGNFLEAWNKGRIRCIPETAGASTIEKWRPIALQQLKKKWFMRALLIQVEDILCQMTPPQQVGCIKHQQMQHHIWGVRGECVTLESMMPIDSATPSPPSHNFIRAALTFFSFPPTFLNLIIPISRSEYHFLVGSAAVREVKFYQEIGIGQGDAFPPQLLLLLRSHYHLPTAPFAC